MSALTAELRCGNTEVFAMHDKICINGDYDSVFIVMGIAPKSITIMRKLDFESLKDLPEIVIETEDNNYQKVHGKHNGMSFPKKGRW